MLQRNTFWGSLSNLIIRPFAAACVALALFASGASGLSRADLRHDVDEYSVSFVDSTTRDKHDNDYANALVNTLHWGHFPIRIGFTNAMSSDRQKLDEIAERGFDQWVRATQGEVKYEVVSNPSRADLTITYEVVSSRPLTGGKLGTTGFNYDPNKRQLRHADMHLNVWEGMTRRDLTRFENTAAHEFGHALGINGHSPDPDDLMYYTSSHSDGVTARDLNTLRQAYGGFAHKATAETNKKNAKTRS